MSKRFRTQGSRLLSLRSLRPLIYVASLATAALALLHAASNASFGHRTAVRTPLPIPFGHDGRLKLRRRALGMDPAEERTAAAAPPPPPAHLPQQLYLAVLHNHSLLASPGVGDAFLATPWLLPPGTIAEQLLSYRGLHNDLGALLRVRARTFDSAAGSKSSGASSVRAVSLVYFSHPQAVLLQNWVYTAVKWAGITNYIVATSDERSLAACLAMHLPCFNATSYLVRPLESAGQEAQFHSKDFFPVTWVKPKLTRDVLQRGYHVHSSDVDIAFPPKAFWPSMLRFLEGPDADVALERDLWGPVNTGCVVVRPTKFGLSWIDKWVAGAADHAAAGRDDQQGAMSLGEDAFRTCEGPWDCARMREEREELRKQAQAAGKELPSWALVRRYHSAWDSIFQDHCAAAHPEWLSPIDPCLPSHTNYHAVCVTGAANKILGFRGAGLWFLDDEETSGCMEIPAGAATPAEVEEAIAFAAEFVRQAAVRQAASGGQLERLPLRESTGAKGGMAGDREQHTLSLLGTKAGERLVPPASKRRQLLGGTPRAEPQAGQVQGSPDSGEHQLGMTAGQHVPLCRPLHWRLSGQEKAFLRCDREQLAYVNYPQA